MQIGQIIRKYRRAKDLTQTQLAEELGHSNAAAISKIELGINDISFEDVMRIAKVLEVDPLLFVIEYKGGEYAGLYEYLPYLSDASSEAISTIRFMLHMPPKKIYNSESKIG